MVPVEVVDSTDLRVLWEGREEEVMCSGYTLTSDITLCIVIQCQLSKREGKERKEGRRELMIVWNQDEGEEQRK